MITAFLEVCIKVLVKLCLGQILRALWGQQPYGYTYIIVAEPFGISTTLCVGGYLITVAKTYIFSDDYTA